MSEQIRIPFSPPDITEAEIAEVADALRSGWITTGPKTKQLERELAAFLGTPRVACLGSATAALECALRALGIGPGDEVITSAYTYTASCSPICHVGATPVLFDVAPGSYEMDYAQLEKLITPRTKAIIPVDLGGVMCDYDALFGAIDAFGGAFAPSNARQEAIGRIAVVTDGAHALGSVRHGKHAGQVADLTTFSFHAVKNFTTAEGGAVTWREDLFDPDELYHDFMLMSLHGQSKDALAKTKAGAWEYDVAFPGWKCNMTDLQAGLGLAQLRRYPGMLARRRQMIARYTRNLADLDVSILQHYRAADGSDACNADDAAARADAGQESSSGHLMLARLNGCGQQLRNRVIELMAEDGVATNVHYKPLPLLTAYRNLGFDIADFPNALAQFANEITLPLHTKLTDDDIDEVCRSLHQAISQAKAEGTR
ncbi:DegT/DnrJ/EryC1/StrS aminotransferase family protein [uncultured Senegalimassilia sp.]|uniref:DegT/DnrJ/EryC1/StrS family aminotransferase n=1 Tax=uncultured Senegalimassilia sp. TaxID=1714350 RepID=UPI0026119B37|nr:DegT/DnrJ/EryC1/StrS aminotransferase family protein [uncultured Senegalimassilia sp.]